MSSILILHRGRQLLHRSLADLRAEIANSGQAESLEDLFFRLTEKPEPATATVAEEG